MNIKITSCYPEMCECGRLYNDRKDNNGKMMCSACYTGLSVDDLKKMWGNKMPEDIKTNLNKGTQ